MRLCTIATGDRHQAGLVIGDTVYRIPEAVAPGPDPLLALLRSEHAGDGLRQRIEDSVEEVGRLCDVQLASPILRPPNIIAVGLNYREHSIEFGHLEVPERPILFNKYPSSVTGPGAEVVVRPDVSEQVDFEVELAAVVGRTCGPDRPGTIADVFGYTVANDLTARDLQAVEPQWSRCKSLSGFCPLGPAIVTADEIGDPQQLDLLLAVNGELMQAGNTRDMVFGIDYLMRWISAGSILEPGDVILTGTPPGIGAKRNPPRFLKDKDEVVATVVGIGDLRNTIRWAAPGDAVHND